MSAVTGKQKRINAIPLKAKKADYKWNTKYIMTNSTEKRAHPTSPFDSS